MALMPSSLHAPSDADLDLKEEPLAALCCLHRVLNRHLGPMCPHENNVDIPSFQHTIGFQMLSGNMGMMFMFVMCIVMTQRFSLWYRRTERQKTRTTVTTSLMSSHDEDTCFDPLDFQGPATRSFNDHEDAYYYDAKETPYTFVSTACIQPHIVGRAWRRAARRRAPSGCRVTRKKTNSCLNPAETSLEGKHFRSLIAPRSRA